jgi:hypothetical protein
MFPFSKWLVFTCRSLAGSTRRLTAFRAVSHQTYQERFAHCLLCGCWLDAKVQMPHEGGPEGKWGEER